MKRYSLLLLATLLLGACVRIYRLNHFSYWLDEILEAYWIRGSWDFFWKSLKFDAVHPPLDYLIERGLEWFGPSDPIRKIPDVVWGLGSVAAISVLLLRRAGVRVALITAAMLALAPFHVRYSQELRPHILGLFSVTLSLLLLDLYLANPTKVRLISVFMACLMTAYSLYLGAVVLAVAVLSMLLEDAFLRSADARSHSARRFLVWSPLFGLALWLAYLPWWPVVMEAIHRPPPATPEPITVGRLALTLSFYSFGAFEGDPLKIPGVAYGLLAVLGMFAAGRRPGIRFLLGWLLGGTAAIEILGAVHPHWYATRRLLTVAPALTALVALVIAVISKGGMHRKVCAAAFLTGILFFSLGGLRRYFLAGRPDWRPIANALRQEPRAQRVFTQNQWTELCLAFYLEGPDWLYRGGKLGRDVWTLDGEIKRLTWSWKPGTVAWLVLGGAPDFEEVRRWSAQFPGREYPTTEGKGRLVKLSPGQRDSAFKH